MSRARVVKKLILYRNGDPSFRPLQYLYSNQKVRTFEKLLEELDEKVPPLRGGAVRYLYSLDGAERIESMDQIEGSERPGSELKLVVAAKEPFRPVKGGYENIGKEREWKEVNETNF